MRNAIWADRILRLGVAFAFLYPPFSALSDPYSWLGYFPPAIKLFAESHGIQDFVLLHGFGVVEVVLALWLLSGKKIYVPATLMALMLLAIVVFDADSFEILFRDLAIALAALSLAVGHWPRRVVV